MNGIFGRTLESGDVALFYEDGHVLDRLDTTPYAPAYCVDDGLGAAYEHPNGLIITRQDARRLDIEIEEA